MANNNRRFSNITNDFLKNRIGVDLDNCLIEHYNLEDLIEIKKVPKEIKEYTFKSIVNYLRTVDFFNPKSKEVQVDDLMMNIIPILVSFIKSNFKIKNLVVERELEIIGIYELTNEEVEMIKRRMEIIFLGNPVDKAKHNSPFLVIENKRASENPDNGLNQCVMAMKAMYDYGKSGEDIYGVVNAGTSWRLVKLENGSRIKLSVIQDFIYRTIEKKENHFVEKTNLVDVLYSLITKFLKIKHLD